MFNNSSYPRMLPETSVSDFRSLLSCYKWHLQNNTVSLAQAHRACSMYEDLVRLGTGTDVVFWVMGLLIFICNAPVLLGIITTRELHRPIHIYLANLAVTDVFAGIGLLYRTVGHVGLNAIDNYKLIITFINLTIFTQMISASALSLLSIDAYVAISHPLFFHIHADSAKLRAGVAVSWIVFSLLAFSPSMGWNCLHMQTITTNICISWYPLAFVITCASILFLLCIVMLFTNISVYIAIRQRAKRRLEQTVNQNAQNNTAQEEANRKFEEMVYKARTVMIHVAVAFVCWLLPLLSVAACKIIPDICYRSSLFFAGFCLNSLINPIATIIRTPDLRNAIRQKLTGIHQIIVTLIRGSSVNPQEEQAGTEDVPHLQEGPAHREGQNTPRLAPDEQSAVENCDHIIHDAHGVTGPERSRRGQRTKDLALVEMD